MASIQLGSNIVSDKSNAYIIAEIGVNHEGSIKKAKELILLAKKGGADAAKFQTYKAHKLASKFSPSYWDTKEEETKSQYELFKKYDNFSESDYIKLADFCNANNIEFLSTPFDSDAIDFLDKLMPYYKIASADLTNIPLLRKVATKGKPILLSTGASSLSEIDQAIQTIININSVEIGLLHCILNYPTSNKNANLGMITSLKKLYPELVIGYSDHTIPDKEMTTLTTAFLKGAVIIEKHFTYNKNLKGNDHYHAMDASDLSYLRKKLNLIQELVGTHEAKKPLDSEEISRRNARRSIVAKKALPKGALIQETDITYKRPGTGISPLHWDQVIGMKLINDVKEDSLIKWMDLE